MTTQERATRPVMTLFALLAFISLAAYLCMLPFNAGSAPAEGLSAQQAEGTPVSTGLAADLSAMTEPEHRSEIGINQDRPDSAPIPDLPLVEVTVNAEIGTLSAKVNVTILGADYDDMQDCHVHAAVDSYEQGIDAKEISLAMDERECTFLVKATPSFVRFVVTARQASDYSTLLGYANLWIDTPGEYDIEIELVPTIKVTGRAVDADNGAGVPNAAITHSYCSGATLTDEDGYFQVVLPRENISFSIQAVAEYYGESMVMIDISPDGFWSTETPRPGPPVQTKKAGRLQVTRLDNGDTLIVDRSSYKAGAMRVPDVKPVESVFLLKMHASKSITGSILANEGLGLEAYKVIAVGHFYTSKVSMMVDAGEQTPQADGSFRIAGLRGDIRHSVFAVGPGVIIGYLSGLGPGEQSLGSFDLSTNMGSVVQIVGSPGRDLQGLTFILGVALGEEFDSPPLTSLDAWTRSQASYMLHMELFGPDTLKLPSLYNCVAAIHVEDSSGTLLTTVSYRETLDSGFIKVP